MRRSLAALSVAVVAAVTVACGRRGDPLAPLRPVPAAVTAITARRLGGQVTLRFTLPAKNLDNTSPVDLLRVDVFARSTPEGSSRPVREQLVDRANLVGSIDVKTNTPAQSDARPAAKDTRPAPGDAALFVDTIPTDPPKPLEPTERQKAEAKAAAKLPQPPPSVTPPQPVVPLPLSRYYMIETVSTHGRRGALSPLIGVPLTEPPAAPSDAVLKFDEKTVTLSWTSETAKQFNVYDVDETGVERDVHPLNASPIPGPFSMPVEFGKPRCFAVRAAQAAGNVLTESAALGPACITPLDTFPPPAPTGLKLLASSGNITLVWDAVQADDLAGYQVLRAEGADENMRQLSTELVTSTTYQDATTKVGVTYTYAIVAVDKAGNKSAASARERETGR